MKYRTLFFIHDNVIKNASRKFSLQSLQREQPPNSRLRIRECTSASAVEISYSIENWAMQNNLRSELRRNHKSSVDVGKANLPLGKVIN